jgi:type I restriction enzyme S subunit
MEFNTKALKDLVDTDRGISYGIVQPGAYIIGGTPIIRVNNLVDNNILTNDMLLVEDSISKKYGRTILKGGELLLSLVGTVGHCVIAPESTKGWNVARAIGVIPLKPNVNRKWVKYCIQSPTGQVYIQNRLNTTVQATFNLRDLAEMPIPYPKKEIQDSIAATLSSLDDKIELNNRIIANLEAQAQAIFKSWFVDFEPFQEGEFVESELGLIPKGWRCGTFSDLGNIEGGSTPSKSEPSYYCENGIPWITPRDLSSDKRKFIDRGANDITESGLKNSSAKILPAGTVLFSSRAPIGYITIAKNGVSTNQGFKSIIPFKMIGTAYVYYYLKQNTDRIIAAANGSTFKEISGTVLKNLTALIPEAQILKDFSAFCETLFKQQAVLEEQNGILTITRDTLLPRLMSGEIEVPVEG